MTFSGLLGGLAELEAKEKKLKGDKNFKKLRNFQKHSGILKWSRNVQLWFSELENGRNEIVPVFSKKQIRKKEETISKT